MYNAIVLSAFWMLIVFYRRESYIELRQMAFFAGLFAFVVLLTAGLARLFPGRPELVPIPFAAILVTILYNGRIGVFAAVILAILAVAGMLGSIAIGLGQGWSAATIIQSCLLGAIMAVASAALAMMVMPM